jgi:hypothetical protein
MQARARGAVVQLTGANASIAAAHTQLGVRMPSKGSRLGEWVGIGGLSDSIAGSLSGLEQTPTADTAAAHASVR